MDRHLREDVKSDCQFSIEIRGYGNAAYLDGTKCVVLRDDRSGNSWNPVYVYGRPFLRQSYTVLTGAGIFALLLLMKQFMGFMNKEDIILDGLLDYMENTLPARKPVPDEQALKEQTREELIDKVTEGIRQTAASETKFSHMLTPEEEHIMREVIREYLI